MHVSVSFLAWRTWCILRSKVKFSFFGLCIYVLGVPLFAGLVLRAYNLDFHLFYSFGKGKDRAITCHVSVFDPSTFGHVTHSQTSGFFNK